jgi:tetratricopeptide (TPR) repeat protein
VEVLEPGAPDPYGCGITSRAWLAWGLSFLGEFAEGIRHGEEALRLAAEAGQGFPPIVAHTCLGRLYLAKGDLEQAVHVLDGGLALCRAIGSTNWSRGLVASLGHAYALMGRLVEGRALLEDAIREDIRTRMISLWVGWLSEVCLLAGRLDAAWQYAQQARDLARQRGERAYEAFALRQLGAVRTHTDPPDVEQAETLYRQALDLAGALRMRPLVAHCHFGLGTLYAKIGRPEQARAELSTAIELYRAMDMTFWPPQAEAALAHIGG